MLDSSLNQVARYFVLGVVGLLLTITFNLFQNSIEETGDRYYRIPLLGNEFRGKRARQAAVILIPLFGFILMAVLQPQLVQIALSDLRVLSTLCGLLIGMVLVSSSAEPEQWKINDGRPLTHYAALVVILLTLGPWVGPWLAKVLIQFLARQYSRLIAFFTTQFSILVGFMSEWIIAHTPEMVGFFLGLLLLGYVVLNGEND